MKYKLYTSICSLISLKTSFQHLVISCIPQNNIFTIMQKGKKKSSIYLKKLKGKKHYKQPKEA